LSPRPELLKFPPSHLSQLSSSVVLDQTFISEKAMLSRKRDTWYLVYFVMVGWLGVCWVAETCKALVASLTRAGLYRPCACGVPLFNVSTAGCCSSPVKPSSSPIKSITPCGNILLLSPPPRSLPTVNGRRMVACYQGRFLDF
jgi:hypothetical protein